MDTDSSGLYQVSAVTPDGCTNTATVVVTGGCNTVGVNSVGNPSDIRVFPVPGKGLLYTDCTGEWTGHELTFHIFGTGGKNLWATVRPVVNGRETLDLRHLPAGNYQLVVTGAGKMARFGVVLVE